MKVNKNGSPLFRVDIITKTGSVAKIILLPFWAITIAFCIIIDLFMAYKYPICDVFHCFCKIARFFATEPVHRVTPERKAQGSYNHLGEQGSLQAGKRGVSYI